MNVHIALFVSIPLVSSEGKNSNIIISFNGPCLQAAKARAVFSMLGQFTGDEVGMQSKLQQLEQCVASQRVLTTLNGTLSKDCLEAAIDMLRAKTKFPIRPHQLRTDHHSVLVKELQSDGVAGNAAALQYETRYKHFDGISFRVLKAWVFENENTTFGGPKILNVLENLGVMNDVGQCKRLFPTPTVPSSTFSSMRLCRFGIYRAVFTKYDLTPVFKRS